MPVTPSEAEVEGLKTYPTVLDVPGAIDIPRTTGVVKFDGRDQISATDSVAVTHATWPTAINALHSEMAAAFDTSRWGLQFVAPVGTNTPAQGTGAAASFTYTGMEIMAKADGTTIQIDADADINHTYEITATINEGQTYYVNGTVRQGAKVIAGKPVQVFLMTGRITSNYEDRSYQVFPTEGLVNNYIVPASTSRSDGTFPTALYIHNPQVTLMRTNVEECRQLGTILASKVNSYTAPTTVLIPRKAISVISAEGGPFHDTQADAALFDAIESTLRKDIEVRSLDLKINHPEFAQACVEALLENIAAVSVK